MLFIRIYLYFEVLYVLLWSCAICVNLMTIACKSRAINTFNSCDCQILIVSTENMHMVLAHKGLTLCRKIVVNRESKWKTLRLGQGSVQAKCQLLVTSCSDLFIKSKCSFTQHEGRTLRFHNDKWLESNLAWNFSLQYSGHEILVVSYKKSFPCIKHSPCWLPLQDHRKKVGWYKGWGFSLQIYSLRL